MSEYSVLEGIAWFNERGADAVRTRLAELAQGQRPRAMFLTCADSRVVPHLITSSRPGDVFTLRNLGNLIPRYGEDPDISVISTLEFAIENLQVPDLVICGHSDCGAMTALLSGVDPANEWLGRWLQAAEPTLRRWRSGPGFAGSDRGDVDRMVMTNLQQQLENARTVPFVRRAVAEQRLRITAAFFDIGAARVLTYDEETGRFV